MESAVAHAGRRFAPRARAAALDEGHQIVLAAQIRYDVDMKRGKPFPPQMMPLADAQLEDAAHRLWWERLCDFWQLKWHYERSDRSCDHLFASASALLEWWCAHRGEVCAAFMSS